MTGDVGALTYDGAGIYKSITHVFDDGLFGIACARGCRVKGAVIKSVPLHSWDHGDLIEDESWSAVVSDIKSTDADAFIFTPPSGSYRSSGDHILKALRSVGGKDWYGLPGVETSLKDQMQEQDLLWLRTSEVCWSLTQQGLQWVIV